MQHHHVEAVRFLVATALAASFLVASAQDVGSLRQASYDLSQTRLDSEGLTLIYGALDAAQRLCSSTLAVSLAAERALAARETFDAWNLDNERRKDQLASEADFQGTPHTWLPPWQQANGFGSIRRVVLAGREDYLAVDDGHAYVIGFLE